MLALILALVLASLVKTRLKLLLDDSSLPLQFYVGLNLHVLVN